MDMSLVKSKVLLVLCNFLLLASGCTLVIGGLMLFLDSDRLLLSKLLSESWLFDNEEKNNKTIKSSFNEVIIFSTKPPLYYVALGCACLGLVVVSVGTLGCWSSCLRNHCTLTIYFFVITSLLVGECAIFTIAWLWPHCLGLSMDAQHLSTTLQQYYGTPGHEQFTAALDLAQANFRCCGIHNDIEYNTSIWKVKAYRPGLMVPLTCCKLDGEDEKDPGIFFDDIRWNRNKYKYKQQYLDPTPLNVTLCQEPKPERQSGFRHLQACGDSLENWFQQQYIIFLGCGLILVLIEFFALLSTVLACTQIYKNATKTKRNDTQINLDTRSSSFQSGRLSRSLAENIYHEHKHQGSTIGSSRRQQMYHNETTYIPGPSVDDTGSIKGHDHKIA